MRVTSADLASIRTIYRQDDSLTLWGIPYGMRPGQSPRDIQRANNARGWVYLGNPGWWGELDAESIACVKAWLAERAECIPGGPCEHAVLPGPALYVVRASDLRVLHGAPLQLGALVEGVRKTNPPTAEQVAALEACAIGEASALGAGGPGEDFYCIRVA